MHMKIAVTEIPSGAVSKALSLLSRCQKCLCCSHLCECCGCWEALPTSQRRSPPSPSSPGGDKSPLCLQLNPLRGLEYCTWPSHCSAEWEQACSVSLSQGLWGHHIISPFPCYLSLYSSLIKQFITMSSLKNMIALLSTSVALSLGITRLNPFGVLSVHSSWILNCIFPLNR